MYERKMKQREKNGRRKRASEIKGKKERKR